jgi:hypothetical protein
MNPVHGRWHFPRPRPSFEKVLRRFFPKSGFFLIKPKYIMLWLAAGPSV